MCLHGNERGNLICMFFRASSFNGDISSWNVSSVADMNNMFNSAYVFNWAIASWNVRVQPKHWSVEYGLCDRHESNVLWGICIQPKHCSVECGQSTIHELHVQWGICVQLCAWRNTIPLIVNNNIFANSGCRFKAPPTTSAGPFCAVETCPSA